jgi:hypothetical protein
VAIEYSELCWLAGLLEGEGCFQNRSDRYFSPLIQLIMTDKDVVVRAAKAMGAHKVVQPTTKTSAGTVLYRVNVYGTVAADLMRSLLPHMGERRSRKITEILEAAVSRPRSPYPIRKSYSRGAAIVWSAVQ